jgi:hypothetical protein
MKKDLVRYKKQVYPVSDKFTAYLKKYGRGAKLSIKYQDLLRFDDGLAIYDQKGNNTLWLNTFYSPQDRAEIDQELKRLYSMMYVDGGDEILPYLNVDSIDFCTFGNTKPFRVKVRNILNDNYTLMYVKNADASRAYGLELEHLLSPNQILFLLNEDTLVEEHISGIPGDEFINSYLPTATNSEKSAIAKEFVKFNERCFLRLLGDMRAYNFVMVLLHDFDRIQFRFRAIDFDQQSYEGDLDTYSPKLFKENETYQQLVDEFLSQGSIEQYKREERALIARRASSEWTRLKELLECMKETPLSEKKNVDRLKKSLYEYAKDINFKRSDSMGELVEAAIDFVVRNYKNINPYILR